MNIEQTYSEDHQIKLSVEADQDRFEKAKYLAARELSKNRNIPGYRPGKAPYQLIVNHLGEAPIIDKALENFLDEIYPQVLDELDEEPYGPGKLEEVKSLEPPVFEFVIPLQPEVELGDYQQIRVEYQESEVSDEDVDEMVNRIASQQAVVEEVDHPAEVGNIVDTSLSGRLAEADPEDEEAQVMINQPLPVMIKEEDEEQSQEWPFPGFSRQLLGVSVGDQLELTHIHNDSEEVSEELRGQEVLYTVEVEGIRERKLPEIDDEFVQSVSEFETVEEFMDDIRSGISAQSAQEDENTYLNAIFDEILKDATVKYPPQMLENEVEGQIQEIENRLQAQGMELEMYLAMQEMTEEDFREQIRPEAAKRIERGLIIGKIAESENLDINPDEITQEYQEIVNDHFGEGDSEEKSQFMQSGESMNLLNRVSSQMVTQRTIDYLKALAKGDDVSEFLKPEEKVEEEELEGSLEVTGKGDGEEASTDQELEQTEEAESENPDESDQDEENDV